MLRRDRTVETGLVASIVLLSSMLPGEPLLSIGTTDVGEFRVPSTLPTGERLEMAGDPRDGVTEPRRPNGRKSETFWTGMDGAFTISPYFHQYKAIR